MSLRTVALALEQAKLVRVRRGYQIAIDRAMAGLAIDADDAINITSFILEELRRPPARKGAQGSVSSARWLK